MKIALRVSQVLVVMSSILIGMVIGGNVVNSRKENEKTRAIIELEDKKEIIYQLESENSRLESIINNYTIEERKSE